jgi:hypothetical protein
LPLNTFGEPLPLPTTSEVLDAVTQINLRNWARHHREGQAYPHAPQALRGLSRRDVFLQYDPEPSASGVVHTLMWGYPQGTLGPGQVQGLGNALWASEDLATELRVLKRAPPAPARAALGRLNAICEGLGPSTTSKLAYFARVDTDEGPALIYDQMVRRAIRALRDAEFKPLRDAIQPWGSQPDIAPQVAVATYGLYLRTVSAVAAKYGVEADQIEYQLFRLGRIADRV